MITYQATQVLITHQLSQIFVMHQPTHALIKCRATQVQNPPPAYFVMHRSSSIVSPCVWLSACSALRSCSKLKTLDLPWVCGRVLVHTRYMINDYIYKRLMLVVFYVATFDIAAFHMSTFHRAAFFMTVFPCYGFLET